MIITLHAQPEPDIEVYVWRSPTTEPIIMRLANGTAVHLTHKDASALHLQLTAALYEYEEKQS